MTPRQISTFRRNLLAWFAQHRRDMPWRDSGDPWGIWVSEVMLQQTRVETVIPYYRRFIKAFPTVHDLAAARPDTVLKHWEGLGYYARARNLHTAARQVVTDFDGRIPFAPEEFRRLPGVGPYIEAAVLSIAFGASIAAVDGNVKRVLARLLCLADPVNGPDSHSRYQPPATALLNPTHPGDHNQAMMELGALLCTPRTPRCVDCPVSSLCAARQHCAVSGYPIRLAKKTPPLRHVAVGVIVRNRKLLICRRPDHGLLAGLWEFPGGGVNPGESGAAACVREIAQEVGLEVTVEHELPPVDHAYTHFRVHLRVFVCRYRRGRVRRRAATDHAWVSPPQLATRAFPGANRKFIPNLLDWLNRPSENRQTSPTSATNLDR